MCDYCAINLEIDNKIVPVMTLNCAHRDNLEGVFFAQTQISGMWLFRGKCSSAAYVSCLTLYKHVN